MTHGTDQAYPLPDVTGLPNGDVAYGCQGLTKRELFAAMAMQGILSNSEVHRQLRGPNARESLATEATLQADALIEALNAEVKP